MWVAQLIDADRIQSAMGLGELDELECIARGNKRVKTTWLVTHAPSPETRCCGIEYSFESLGEELRAALETTLPDLEAALEAAGAAWTPGRALPPPQ